MRVVPDRGVDEGWTTRLDLPPAPELKIELDVYDGK